MPKLLPDQSFYPSPTMAMQAPAETLAYVALLGSAAPAVRDVLPVLAGGLGRPAAGPGSPGGRDERGRLADRPRTDRVSVEPRCILVGSGAAAWFPGGARHGVDTVAILARSPEAGNPRVVSVPTTDFVIPATGDSRPHTAGRRGFGLLLSALVGAAGRRRWVIGRTTCESTFRVAGEATGGGGTGEGLRVALGDDQMIKAERGRQTC